MCRRVELIVERIVREKAEGSLSLSCQGPLSFILGEKGAIWEKRLGLIRDMRNGGRGCR